MIGYKVFTQFDRSVIKTRWQRMNRNPLARVGARIMKYARNSIRRVRAKKGSKSYDKPSKVGRPPRARSNRGGTTPPMKMIFFQVRSARTSVMIGPVGFGEAKPVTELHEKGGVARRSVFRQKHKQRRHKKTGRYQEADKKKNWFTATVHYPKRPYMGPAFLKVKPTLPRMWQGSLKA